MSTNKPKILVVTTNPPMDEMGGCLLLYRQFIQRDDFEIAVITNREDYHCDGIDWQLARQPKLLERLKRTRLSYWAHDCTHLFGGWYCPQEQEDFARQFDPDLIFIGPETWVGDLGIKIAKKLNVPVVGLFMDWPVFASKAHSFVKRRFSKLYRSRYHACGLAFGISPEMLKALGDHPRARVLYPAGYRTGHVPPRVDRQTNGFTLFFAGNLGQWYGQAIDLLLKELEGHETIRLRIAGTNGPWSKEREEALRKSGDYLGFLKGEKYEQALGEADGLLVIMGFGEEDRIVESTNFKSKLVDYILAERPIIIWGPDYCTAVRHGNKNGFAETVTVPDPAQLVEVVEKLATDNERQKQLVKNGQEFFEKNLNAERVYRTANEEILNLVAGSRG